MQSKWIQPGERKMRRINGCIRDSNFYFQKRLATCRQFFSSRQREGWERET